MAKQKGQWPTAKSVKPLPGSHSPATPDGMHHYLVLLSAPNADQPNASRSRSETAGQWLTTTREFISKFQAWLEETNQKDQVEHIGDATSLGFVEFVGTSGLANQLEQIEEVESVVEDDGSLGLIR